MTDQFLNPFRKKLSQGNPCIGAWLTTGSPQTAEAMASLGFDWLCVDFEHGSADVSQVEAAFVAAERYGAAPVVRISNLDSNLARRLLDMGAMGVIVAAVEDEKEFGDFAAHCLYAPEGRRGVGLSRCNRWGDNFSQYLENFRPVLVPMIETARGVERAQKLANLPMVDALFLGPYDLSSDLGCPADFETSTFKEAVASVRQACLDNAIAVGIHQVEPDAQALQERLDQGFALLAYGTDVVAIRHALGDVKEIIEGVK